MNHSFLLWPDTDACVHSVDSCTINQTPSPQGSLLFDLLSTTPKIPQYFFQYSELCLHYICTLFPQVPSFARRSSILNDLHEASLDEEDEKCDSTSPVHVLRPQGTQYQLNSTNHHKYQSLCREKEMEPPTNGKKFFYQLNSKKHHHYQPDVKDFKVHEPTFVKPPEVKVPDLANKGYSLPPVLQQKWIRDKDSGCLTKIKDITMELKKLPANLNGHRESQSTGLKEDSLPQSNGVSSSKLKIVKNKNKNGRIVIVMSKYMENGMQSAKIKNGDSEPTGNPESGAENHSEKMRLVQKLGLTNGFVKNSGDGSTVSTSGFNGDAPQEREQSTKMQPTVTEQAKHVGVRVQGQLPADQLLQLTTKSNLPSLPVDRGVPSALDKRETQGGCQGLKRPLHDTGTEDCGTTKRFLSSRSFLDASAAPSPTQSTSVDQNGQRSLEGLQVCGYTDQEEPMDLSMVKSRANSEACTSAQPQAQTTVETLVCSQDEKHTQTQTDSQRETQTPTETRDTSEELDVDSLSEPNKEKRKEETFPSFQSFLGNIVITDITTNCLTVTFKEYVTV